MKSHHLQLAAEPFNAIISGSKTIESRLYDEKRQLIELGDTVTFTNREAPDQTVSARVIGLLRYKTFHELFSNNDPLKFGGTSVEGLETQINEFYSSEAQQENGVIGIQFVLL